MSASAAAATVATVRVPFRTAASELRAIKIVWHRELIRYFSDRLRIVTALLQPALFLFVLGTGLSRLASAGTEGLNLRTFFYPGILAMAVLFTAIFSAASVVWDREFGFLREMLVAPVRRSSIVIGKCLGGATVAATQGVLMIALAGLVGVPYAPTLILAVLGLQILLAFMLTAFGLVVAARVTQLTALNRVDPLTYAVDPMRRAVFAHLTISPTARARLDPGVTWGGWHVPAMLQAVVVLAIGLGLLGVAIAEFSRSD